jgi:GT2 family glycosyltransferase
MRSKDDFDLTIKCINTIKNTVDPDSTYILISDDHSPYKEGSEFLSSLVGEGRGVTYCRSSDNQGFSKTVNIGLRTALTNEMDAVLINADIEFIYSGWLEALLEVDAAIVGAKLLYPNGLIQHAGICFSGITRAFDHRYRFAPSDLVQANKKCVCPVTGALQLIRWECLKDIGIYDEDFRMGWEDVEYCLRAFKNEYLCMYQPESVAIHHESAFRGQKNAKIEQWQRESLNTLYTKYAGFNFAKFVPSMIWDNMNQHT